MRRFLKSASVLAVSQGLVAVSTFVRNVVIARHISVADFGVATTFALTMSLVEMTSTMALDRLLVQDDQGESDAMLASAHLLQFCKGLVTALVLFAIAGPIAHVFELPEVTWAFRLLALVPAIRGLVHWDMVVRQRHMDFRATAIVDALPQVASVLVAYLAALWLADYRVMLIVVLAQVGLTTLLSHVLAKRPYRWVFRRDLARKKLDFGWPLLVNGLLMFGIFQGDRVVVGALFDMHTLGWYSVAFSLALLPTLIFAKVCGYLLMPGLSRTKGDPGPYARQCAFALALCFGCGAFMATFFAIGGKALLLLAFGEKYVQGNELLMVLAIGQALRVIRVAPTMIANSQAKTKNAMYSNLVRTVGLPVAAAVAWAGLGVEWVAVCGIGGELLALMASFHLLELAGFKATFVKQSLAMGAGFLLLSVAAFGVFEQVGAPPAVATSALLIALGGVTGLGAAVALTAIDSGTREPVRLLWLSLQQRLAARGARN